MIKVFIIGNGFDLAHGFQTRYTDFIKDYQNNISEEVLNRINSSKHNYEGNLINFNWRDYENLKNSINASANFNWFFSNSVVMSLDDSKRFLPYLFNQTRLINWIDVESGYFNYLIKNKNDYKCLEVLHNDFNIIKKLLLCYLNDNIKEPGAIKFKKFSSYFENLIFGDGNLTKQTLPNLANGQIYLADYESNSDFIFINFNYTDTIKYYVDELNSRKRFKHKIFNIHGSIREINAHADLKKIDFKDALEEKHEDIVFGYGDEVNEQYKILEAENNNLLLNNIKSFSYLNNSKYQELFNYLDKLNGGIEVHILGHSCGISDRILLKRIFNHPKCEKIHITYYKDTKNKIDDFYSKTQEISRHFDNDDSGDSKHKMRLKVVPKSQSKSFSDIFK